MSKNRDLNCINKECEYNNPKYEQNCGAESNGESHIASCDEFIAECETCKGAGCNGNKEFVPCDECNCHPPTATTQESEKITCGNHGCILDQPGVGANGGCKCISKNMTTEEIIRLKKYIYRERDKVKDLEERLKIAVEAHKKIAEHEEPLPSKNKLVATPAIAYYVELCTLQRISKECLKKIGEKNEGK